MSSMETSLRVPFSTLRHAEVALRSLEVDPEPKRSGVTRSLTLEEEEKRGGAVLIATFSCASPLGLRVSVNAFLDLLGLVLDTIRQFDQ